MDEALRAIAANTTRRQRELDRLRAYVKGTQYDNRPSFFSDDVPLRERAPHINYLICKIAIQSHVDMVLGEGRFDGVSVAEPMDDDPIGATEQEIEALDGMLVSLRRRAGLDASLKAALRSAMRERSVAVIVGVSPNKSIKLAIERARNAVPEFDDQGEVVRLEIRYPYLDEFTNENREPAVRAMWFRRVIDGQRDVTYKPAPCREDRVLPVWQEDKVFEHGLGFCPVHWYKFEADEDDGNKIDGCALHESVLDEVDALNFALSMKNRAAIYSGDPQLIEIGVEMQHNPSDEGRLALAIANPTGGGGWVDANAKPPARRGRKRGPGQVWRYPHDNSKVLYLTLPGDALTALENDAKDAREKLQEMLGVVLTNPESMAAEASGRALREHHKRQIERCNSIRDDFRDNCVIPVMKLLLRLVMTVGQVPIAGLNKARAALDRLLPLGGPDLEIAWGPYFDVGGEETALDVQTTVAAKEGGLITAKTATEKIAPAFGIEDVEAYMRELEQEKKAAADEALRQMQQARPADAGNNGGPQPGPGALPKRGVPVAAGKQPPPRGGGASPKR